MAKNDSSVVGLFDSSTVYSLIRIIYQLSFHNVCVFSYMFISFFFSPQNPMPRWSVEESSSQLVSMKTDIKIVIPV